MDGPRWKAFTDMELAVHRGLGPSDLHGRSLPDPFHWQGQALARPLGRHRADAHARRLWPGAGPAFPRCGAGHRARAAPLAGCRTPSPGAFRQWRAAGPMLRYLGRFPDPYTMLPPGLMRGGRPSRLERPPCRAQVEPGTATMRRLFRPARAAPAVGRPAASAWCFRPPDAAVSRRRRWPCATNRAAA